MPKIQKITKFKAELNESEKKHLFYLIYELCERCKHDSDKHPLEIENIQNKKLVNPEEKIVKYINSVISDIVNQIVIELQDN